MQEPASALPSSPGGVSEGQAVNFPVTGQAGSRAEHSPIKQCGKGMEKESWGSQS